MRLAEESVPTLEQRRISWLADLIEASVDKDRDAHANARGLVKASFEVCEDLPPQLRVGIFKEPKTFPALIRFSNGQHADDSEGDVRGMAIKLIGVHGNKVLESEQDATTHDFVLVNHPVFIASDVDQFIQVLTAKKTGQLDQFLAKNASLRAIFKASMRAIDNLLLEKFHSQTPYLFGKEPQPDQDGAAVKYMVEIADVSDQLPQNPNDLQEALFKTLEDREISMKFFVQFQTDPEQTPIENATTKWNSGFHHVATIVIPADQKMSQERRKLMQDLSFTPWHCLPEHRPLGGINRARKVVYEKVSEKRHQQTGVQRREPASSDFDELE